MRSKNAWTVVLFKGLMFLFFAYPAHAQDLRDMMGMNKKIPLGDGVVMSLNYNSMNTTLASCDKKEQQRRWIIDKYNLPTSLEFRGGDLVNKWKEVVGWVCWIEHKGMYYVLRNDQLYQYR